MHHGMRLRAMALVACVAVAVFPPRASQADEPTATSVAAARKHFEKARAFYGQGAYREAITELEAAHTLDPSAKDLVFNLGVVHEKLSDIDDALRWFRQYTTMELTVPERDRADAYVRRLEGAKKELEQKQAAQQIVLPLPTAQPPSPEAPVPEAVPPLPPPAEPLPPLLPHATPPRVALPPQPPPPPPPPPLGRVDGLTVGAASLSAAGLVFGVVMGVMELQDRPRPGSVANNTTTYQTLLSENRAAYREAVLADIGFGTALVSGLVTGYLYFGRTRFPSSPTMAPASVSAAPLPRGGGLFLKGHF